MSLSQRLLEGPELVEQMKKQADRLDQQLTGDRLYDLRLITFALAEQYQRGAIAALQDEIVRKGGTQK